MKKFLSVLLIFTVSIGLCSCGESTKKFVGKWRFNVNVADVYNDFVVSDEDVEDSVAEYLKIDKLVVKYAVEFNKNGTYNLKPDDENFQGAYEEMVVKASAGIRKYYELLIKEKGYNMDVDTYMDSFGIDGKEITRQIVTKDDMKKAMPHREGKYFIKENRLYMTPFGEILDMEKYDVFEIVNDEQIDILAHKGEVDGVLVYPYTLTKINESVDDK